jgi:hypothetical protein
MEATMTASRDDIRTKIFGAKTEKAITSFNGANIEVRQPTLKEIFAVQTSKDAEDLAAITVDMLIKYCYVPNTDDRIFETADAEALLGLPFNSDMQRLSTTLNKLIGGQKLMEATKDATKSLEEGSNTLLTDGSVHEAG